MQIYSKNKEGNDIPIMVFRNEKDDKVYYQLGLSRKDMENNYVNGYIMAQFNKDVSIVNMTKIVLKNAILDFYLKDKITVPFIRVFDFEYAEDTFVTVDDGDLPF